MSVEIHVHYILVEVYFKSEKALLVCGTVTFWVPPYEIINEVIMLTDQYRQPAGNLYRFLRYYYTRTPTPL